MITKTKSMWMKLTQKSLSLPWILCLWINPNWSASTLSNLHILPDLCNGELVIVALVSLTWSLTYTHTLEFLEGEVHCEVVCDEPPLVQYKIRIHAVSWVHRRYIGDSGYPALVQTYLSKTISHKYFLQAIKGDSFYILASLMLFCCHVTGKESAQSFNFKASIVTSRLSISHSV